MTELNDEEMHFDRFMKHTNDFYSQRQNTEGIERIFKLFDNEGIGIITREDLRRIAN